MITNRSGVVVTPAELRVQAQKYRSVVGELAPNAPGRDYYLSRAEELERQVRVVTTDTSNDSPPPSIPESQPPQPITLRQQTRVHADLAVAVLQDERSNIHRAFSVWLTLRQLGKRHFDKSQVIEFYAKQTGIDPRNVRRWIDSGDGIFLIRGRKNRISLIGKNQVFANYGIPKTGRVLPIPTESLLGGLQQLRSALYSCWQGGKSRWAARGTIRQITSVSESSQLNYDRQNKQKKQFTYAVDWRTETSQTRQLPNRYQAVHKPAHDGNRKNRIRYGLYTPESRGVPSIQGEALSPGGSSRGIGLTVGNGRILFEDVNKGLVAARKRARKGKTGQCFGILSDTPKGNLLLKTLDYESKLH